MIINWDETLISNNDSDINNTMSVLGKQIDVNNSIVTKPLSGNQNSPIVTKVF